MTATTLLITFNLPLTLSEVPLFRGAVLNAITEGKDVLMHNHLDEGLRYSYPLIQYKSIGGKAAILCIDKGVDESGSMMQVCNKQVNIGRDRLHESVHVEHLFPNQTEIQVGEAHKYSIHNWLPLNEKNFEVFNSTESTEGKLSLMEHTLVGNILSMAKGLGIFFDEKIQCKICMVLQCPAAKYKQIGLAVFDVEFLCNVNLPDYIGLGKHASVGYGIVTKLE